jgi:ABC-type nitrate/sulfonate/bicarbonate transport system substrate-binding protein
VDAITGAYWNWEAVQIQLKGQPVNVMHLDQWGVPNYDELVFVTSEQLLQSKPDLVRAFVAAEMKGEQYAIDHPDEAEQALLAANKDLEKPLVEQSLKLLAPVWKADAPRLGYLDPKQWQAYERWMRSKNLISKDVDVSQAMTDEYLPQS